jgi:hypothetical protein
MSGEQQLNRLILKRGSHPGVDAKISLRPLKHRRLIIGEKPNTQSVVPELSRATWLIAHPRDWPQSTQSLDLDGPLSVRELEEDTLECELASWRR